ncbi:hypothetical protein SSX86_000623 [Deinandra increscens subsp. villosa]|uniref:Uncharacterized protein n=1 Tax=Deinandra increscens subsp. villosa TaxID=3103831 RepID=A0AAP0DXJ2_9ASTR
MERNPPPPPSPWENQLRSLLHSIKVSDVVETRTQLISQLGELDVTDGSERASILEFLTTSWEDFTCLDVSQCMLNKTILQVATTYLESDVSICLTQLLALGTKASIWSRKHMKMTLMSTIDSQDSQEEEHYCLFFQVLLNMLSHSASVLRALERLPVSTGKELMSLVETFIMELLNLTKDSILEVKKILTFGPEVLKASQVVLDAVISLCKAYCNDVKLDYDATTEKDDVNHIITITKCAVETLVNLGVVAANDGGDLVTVLNLSWKGVVTLLQLYKGTLSVKMNISEVIMSLISLATGSLSCAGKTWSTLMEPVSMADARRIFIPVKFYLINAARIISHYPSQAFSIFKDITLCILIILSFRIFLGEKEIFKSASEALTELLEPTAIHLLNSLLNSAQLEHNHKCQILDWLFSDIPISNFAPKDGKWTPEIFSSACDLMNGSNTLLLGQLSLFVNLLRSGPDLEDGVTLEIAKKLNWLLDILIEENVYSSILSFPVPLLHNSGHQNMYSSVIHALKTFMLVVSSTSIWRVVESFLLENFFHPHHLCWEIIMELWCFLIRHAESDTGNDIIIKLCTILKTTASWESVLNPDSVLRKLAKSICMILKNGSPSLADTVFNFIFNSNLSKLSSAMYIALLIEGFPLNFLSDKVRSLAKKRLVTDYFCFLDAFDDESSSKYGDGMFGAPVFALSAALQSLQVSISDTEMKTIKLLTSMVHKYNNTRDNSKDRYLKLVSETLGIISGMKHLYLSDEMEKLILELRNLFTLNPSVPNTELTKCKPNLAAFVAGLGDIEFEESDHNSKFSASWELFHMLLQERHWALAHLAITAFGYFSARTSCKELWRFVPEDAALSFDCEFGKDTDEERFMSEFKVFLDKEAADVKTTPSENEVALLVKEGLVLKQMVEKILIDAMEVDEIRRVDKKRKFPEGISEGVSLLQNGLRAIANGISLWKQNRLDYSDVNGEFLTKFSQLEDAVEHMAAAIEYGGPVVVGGQG